ncbi:o-succinylbenzoate--CoA ligase [Glaesserella sp.]|uniref:o-succinylbenzoate--CoA ligase n=1 Tax=Glaesserella sp. TaxID=2094731 RepID=UPI00359F5C90
MTEPAFFPSTHWAVEAPQRTAIVWEKGDSTYLDFLPSTLSWQRWHQLVAQAVTFLHDLGAKQNYLLAYLGTHRLCGVLCYSAAIAMGARILMLNPAMTVSQRQTILAENVVDVLITEDDFAKFNADLTACQLASWDSSTPSTLTLTSGSSSTPKAVVHTARQHLANAVGVCEFMQFGAENSWLLSLPLFHVSGQGIVWRWLSVGATLFISEDKDNFWQMLAQVSHASLVPTQLQRYLAQLASSVRLSQHILLGGAAIPAELIARAQQYQISTYAGYGMTEAASTICAAKGDTDNVGKPLRGREVRIVEGEIRIRGGCLALGYWQQGKIVPLPNTDGWFPTKDKGRWNSDGNLVVLGRLDNMFISGGENIQPEEIERVLSGCEQVNNVIIVPYQDDEFGERPVAFVEFVGGFHLQAVTLLQHFAKMHLEKFKQPIRYLPLDQETWQSSGIKVSRTQLKAYAAKILREHND